MASSAEKLFRPNARTRSLIEIIRQGPPGPPTRDQIAGRRMPPTMPGRLIAERPRTVPGSRKPVLTWGRGEFVDFLGPWLELDQEPIRITLGAVRAEIELICDALGLRRFKDHAHTLAQEVRPTGHKKAGPPGKAQKTATERWCERMRDKREGQLQDN
jgi:hypothetical protein